MQWRLILADPPEAGSAQILTQRVFGGSRYARTPENPNRPKVVRNCAKLEHAVNKHAYTCEACETRLMLHPSVTPSCSL